MDAFATPFVQGRLRQRDLTVTIETSCAHTGRPMRITVGSDLEYEAADGAEPVIFVPHVDVPSLEDDSIIDAF